MCTYLQVVLVSVEDEWRPLTRFVAHQHHGEGEEAEGGVEVCVLCIHHHYHLVRYRGLAQIAAVIMLIMY